MIKEFNAENITFIGKVLNAEVKQTGGIQRLEVVDPDSGRKLALEIYTNLQVKRQQINMVSVYSQNTFLQLHNCMGFVASDVLKQVTFFGKHQGMVSGLIVEPTGGCSLYSNVDEQLLSEDFTQLPHEVMMASVALSLTENVDMDNLGSDDDE